MYDVQRARNDWSEEGDANGCYRIGCSTLLRCCLIQQQKSYVEIVFRFPGILLNAWWIPWTWRYIHHVADRSYRVLKFSVFADKSLSTSAGREESQRNESRQRMKTPCWSNNSTDTECARFLSRRGSVCRLHSLPVNEVSVHKQIGRVFSGTVNRFSSSHDVEAVRAWSHQKLLWSELWPNPCSRPFMSTNEQWGHYDLKTRTHIECDRHKPDPTSEEEFKMISNHRRLGTSFEK